MTFILDGLSGGSDCRSKTSSGNGKAEKQKEKVQIPIFKYTARSKKPLHEAILLGNEAFFLMWDEQREVMKCVRNIEETNRILRPPDEGEYPYESIEFSSIEEVKEYSALAQHETIDSLYQRVKSMVFLYIDQEPEIIILISADIIWTYFQDLFPTTHYYDVNGKTNGIGKSTIGHVFEGLGYRTVRMVDPSSTNLFRVLGQIEPGQCIIVADEADRIHNDKDALSIMKEGYQIRARVPKTNPNTFKQEWFYCYCFKVRIAEEPLQGNVTKGVIDRSFQIKAIRGSPTHDIKEVLNPASRIDRLEKLRNDLSHLRKLLLCYRLVHFTDNITDVDVGLEGRDKELTKPLLQLFYGSNSYNEIRRTVLIFLNRKNKRKKSTAIEPLLFEIVVNMIDLNPDSKKCTTLLVDDIWNKIKTEIPGFYNYNKPNEFQTFDYNTIYRTTTSKMLEGFGAEHDRGHKGRTLVFNPRLLAKTAKQFDVSKDTQIKLKNILDRPIDTTDTLSRAQKDENITNHANQDKNNVEKSNEIEEKKRHDGVTAVTATILENTNTTTTSTTPFLGNLNVEHESQKQKQSENNDSDNESKNDKTPST